MAGAFSSAYSSAFDVGAAGTVVTPAVIALSVSLPTPTLAFGAVVQPAILAITVSLPTPTFPSGTPTTVTPEPISLPIIIRTPVTSVEAPAATPATVSVTVTLPGPTAVIGGPIVVLPARIALTVSFPTVHPAIPGGEARIAREALVVSITDEVEPAARVGREAVVVGHTQDAAEIFTRLGRLAVMVAISRPHGWD